MPVKDLLGPCGSRAPGLCRPRREYSRKQSPGSSAAIGYERASLRERLPGDGHWQELRAGPRLEDSLAHPHTVARCRQGHRDACQAIGAESRGLLWLQLKFPRQERARSPVRGDNQVGEVRCGRAGETKQGYPRDLASKPTARMPRLCHGALKVAGVLPGTEATPRVTRSSGSPSAAGRLCEQSSNGPWGKVAPIAGLFHVEHVGDRG
jgi:hypothetical protein